MNCIHAYWLSQFSDEVYGLVTEVIKKIDFFDSHTVEVNLFDVNLESKHINNHKYLEQVKNGAATINCSNQENYFIHPTLQIS